MGHYHSRIIVDLPVILLNLVGPVQIFTVHEERFIEAAHLDSPTGFDRLREAILSSRRSGRPWNTTQGYLLLGPKC